MTQTIELTENARELHAYATSNPEPMRNVEQAYRRLQQFKAKGLYDSARAVKLLEHTATVCAQMYTRKHGAKGDRYSDLFNIAERLSVALVLVAHFQTEYELGNRW